MQNNFPKFVLLAVVIGAVFFSARTYPQIFISNSATTADAVNNNQATTTVNAPASAFTSLSADASAGADANINGQDNASSGSGQVIVASNDSSTPFARVGTAIPPSVGVAAAIVADLQTGDDFMSVNADERWPMASISKLMTAVVATDVLQPNEDITITAEMTAADPTEHILNIGDTYTVEDLLHVMLLPSNNVAATALADFYGEPQFLAAMNAKAQSWGMTDTYYDDPSGLSAANESTGDDLLKLAQHIYTDYPQILAITRMPTATVNNLTTGKPVVVKSINEFAGDVDFVGGKTGYTDQADGNLLSIFSYENRPIFIVVLGIADGVRFDGTQQLYSWFKANFK